MKEIGNSSALFKLFLVIAECHRKHPWKPMGMEVSFFAMPLFFFDNCPEKRDETTPHMLA
jgi:hypothetical protein